MEKELRRCCCWRIHLVRCAFPSEARQTSPDSRDPFRKTTISNSFTRQQLRHSSHNAFTLSLPSPHKLPSQPCQPYAPHRSSESDEIQSNAVTMSAPAPTSRSREAPQGDEEAAAELKLGEFQDVDALTHSEAALVINALVQKRSMDRKNMNETE
jgi:hypothetical protein